MYNHSKVTFNGGFTTYHSFAYTIAAGPAFFLNPKTAIEVTASYSFLDNSQQYEKINTIMVNAGFQIYLGK